MVDKGYEMHICFYGEDVITCRLFMVAMAGLAISEIVKVYIYIYISIYIWEIIVSCILIEALSIQCPYLRIRCPYFKEFLYLTHGVKSKYWKCEIINHKDLYILHLYMAEYFNRACDVCQLYTLSHESFTSNSKFVSSYMWAWVDYWKKNLRDV